MPAESNPNGLEAVLDLFAAHGVEFIVVGGQAEILLGSSRTTFDVVFCYRVSSKEVLVGK